MTVRTETVLILGAGASHQYGFPLGAELRSPVLKLLDANPGKALLNELGHSASDIRQFGEQLRYSGDTSVDLFLEHNPEYLAIGKHVIAAAMLPKEDETKLFPPDARGDHNWYELLANKMGLGREGWRDNRISVITFNYDRSFEQYFARVLSQRTKVPFERAREEITEVLSVIHVHGSLGSFAGESSLLYGTTPTADTVGKAAQELRVVSEVEDTLPTFEEAAKLLTPARRVYFLGFGFLQANVHRLRVFQEPATPEQTSVRSVAGTNYQVTARDWEWTKKEVFHGHWNEAGFPGNVYTFLRQADLD
jgi:hypothetical protein